MTEPEIEALEKLCEGATGGPWKPHFDKDTRRWSVTAGDFHLVEECFYATENADGGQKNTAFIAAAREALPKLIADLKAERKRAEERVYAAYDRKDQEIFKLKERIRELEAQVQAAREEGRREGLMQAARKACADCCDQDYAYHSNVCLDIQALASAPKKTEP